ncbi:MAG: ComEC family competence protein [Bacteroidetes bacterium]|nr:ComEC family competence protein [Bacteroidota bacterium]
MPLYSVLAGLAIILAAFIISLKSKRSTFFFFSSQAALFLISWLLCFANDVRNNKRWFGHKLNTADLFEARITESPVEKERSFKMRVSVLATLEPGHLSSATGDGFVYLVKDGKAPKFKKGDIVLLPNRWKPIKNAGNPFEFDYAAYCAQNNLYYQQSLSAKDIVLFQAAATQSASFTSRCHDWCMQQLARYIDDKPTLGLIQAMLIGDEVNLDNETRQSFAETGIVHIIAISGGNVAIFFLAISLLLWWLKHKRHQWIKYFIALPLVWLYVLMAGAPPSAVRAAIMFSLLAIGIILQKNNNSLNTLLATAFVLLCAEPMWLYAIGFQLSFIAVLSLILFYTPSYKLYTPGNKIVKALWTTIVASAAAEILTAPLVVYYFHLFPLMFLVANVVAYLFMGLVLYIGMAVLLFSFIPIVAGALGQICIWLVRAFDAVVHWLQRLNPESFYYLQMDAVELILLYALIASVAIWLLRREKSAIFVALVASCAFLFLLCDDQHTAVRQQKFVAYNAGKHIHAELINGKRYSVLYTDTSQQVKNVYATKPTHTAWLAWQPGDNRPPTDLFRVAGYSLLLYHDSLSYPENLHPDYVVLCEPGNIDPAQLYERLHPLCLILPQMPEAQLERWKAMAGRMPVELHYLPDDGAFVLE